MSSEPPRDPLPPTEELVPADDAIIGRVFRWSVVLIAVIVVAVFLGVRLARRGAGQEQVVPKDVGRIADLEQAGPEMPEVRFVDVTADAGIDFVRANGARGEKLLPETMGGGAAFFDYDGDGDQDLLLVNSTDWPWVEGSGPAPTQALYRNDGTGHFASVTAEAGLDVNLAGMGVAVGDYDNDGDRDLFITALGPNRLFRNHGRGFEEVTARAGVAGDDRTWSTSAGFLDYDNDGDLDLFVCNYVKWSREIDIELNFTLNGVDRAYGPPTSYEGRHPYLYRNDGGGKFSDVSESAGVRIAHPSSGRPMAKALAATFADVDQDGHIDVLVANDTVQNFFYHNKGDGTFEETGAASGIGFDGAGNATGAMGLDVAHHRNDYQLAVGIANFANEMSSLYVSQHSDLLFTDESAGEGIGSPSRLYLSFGLFFFDYDLDGRLDMLQSNGHLEDEINQVQASQRFRQPAQLFWNQGPEARSCFAEVPPDTVGDLSTPVVGRGATYADIDGDADLDVLIVQSGGPPLLLRNDQALDHAWLRLELTGTRSNRDAIGAWVVLQAGGEEQRRQVMPTRSYLCQVERPVTFGLGAAGRVDSLEVIWPDGSRQSVPAPALRTTIEVVQEAAPFGTM